MRKSVFKTILSTAVASVVAFSSSVCCFASENVADTSLATNIIGMLDSAPADENFGYEGNLNITFGDSLVETFGVEIQPIDISARINSFDGDVDVDLAVKYNSENLATVDALYEGATGKLFFRMPELNDAYIAGTMEDLEALLASSMMGDMEDYEDFEEFPEEDFDSMVDTGTIDFSALENLDLVELEEHFWEYVDFVTAQLPAGVDGEKAEGQIDGNDYSFDTKSFEITGQDIYDITKSVLEKAKADAYLKELAASLGMDETAYNEEIDWNLELNEETTVEELNRKYDVELYYADGNITGIKVVQDGEEVLRFMLLDNDDVFALDMYSYDEFMEESTSISGSCVPSYGKVNGVFEKVVTDGEYYEEKTTCTLTDLGLDMGVLQGAVKIESVDEWFDDGDVTHTVYDFVSNSTPLKDDMTLKIITEGVEEVTIRFTGEEFEPGAVVIPEESVYNIADSAELMEYMSGCDFEGLLENVKSVLGEELYTIIEEMFTYGDEFEGDDWGDDSYIEPEDSKADDTSKADSNKTNTNKTNTNKTNTNKTNGSDKSANTGVASGLGALTLALAGVAIIVRKKR